VRQCIMLLKFLDQYEASKEWFTMVNGVDEMSKYKCTVCGYVYDPQNGDPSSGIKPGTPFEDLPDDWLCPSCGADKSAFKKED